MDTLERCILLESTDINFLTEMLSYIEIDINNTQKGNILNVLQAKAENSTLKKVKESKINELVELKNKIKKRIEELQLKK